MKRKKLGAAARQADRALLLAALVGGYARWEPLDISAVGEICVNGLRHVAWLDTDGCPLITPVVRDALRSARPARSPKNTKKSRPTRSPEEM